MFWAGRVAPPEPLSRPLPWLALGATVVIWASYLVITRFGVTGSLNWVDIGLLRSGSAALVFLPFTLRHGLLPGGANVKDISVMAGLGGFAFVFALATGLTFAPVADSGVFAPSMLAVWVAVFAVIFTGARYSGRQVGGLALIVAGALFLGGFSAILTSGDGAWRGHLLFLAAAASWAAYTVRFRVSGLSALQATVLMATWATLFFVICAPFTGINFHRLPPDLLALQLGQGLAAGAVANFTFLFSVRTLGAPISAAAAAFVPILAALGGLFFLGEPVGILKWVGVLVAAMGVALASGLFDLKNEPVKAAE